MPGDYTTPNIGEYPSDARESRLSQILEDGPLQKYYLTARACQGILNRAERRGKELPEILKTALENQAQTTTDYSSLVYTEKQACSWDGTQTSATITANNADGGQRMPDKQNFNAIIETPQAYGIGNGQSESITRPAEETAHTLDCMHDHQKVLTYGLDRAAYNQGKNAQFDFCVDEEKIGAMTSRGPGAVGAGSSEHHPQDEKPRQRSIVRRLTPMECERLQGYPDHWTEIGDWIDSKGKKHKGDSDAPRYKALGNSIALPFWDWLAERIIAELKTEGEKNPTMASLFDGIGGFPLVFSNHGCKPIWASEIEEFPIAVTKIRFPEEQDEEEGNE